MRLPSLRLVFERAVLSLRRFPATLLVSITGAILLVIDIAGPRTDGMTTYARLGLTCLLGVPMFLATELYLESRGERLDRRARIRHGGLRAILYIVVLGLLGMFFGAYEDKLRDHYQLIVFLIGAMMVVSFIPFLRGERINAFWQFNKTLFLRIFLAGLFTLVLYLGLSLAILTLDKLFGVPVHNDTYVQLIVLLIGIFGTWFFLAGFPPDIQALEFRDDYPRGLKVFTQFMLLPLVTIYLVILYAYAVKLLIDGELPRGWVSNPVLWFSVASILSFLLLYPIRKLEGNEWIRIFTRFFFVALIPLLVMPALGVYTRIRAYGLTEERYFVVGLTVWLFIIGLYFILAKKRDIRMIPISFAIAALIAGVGPLNAFELSKRSQLERLERITQSQGIVSRTRDTRQQILVPDSVASQLNSIVNYLIYTHGRESLTGWLKQRLPEAATYAAIKKYEDFRSQLNIGRLQRDGRVIPARVGIGRSLIQPTPVTGYDYYIPVYLERFHGQGLQQRITIEGREVEVDLRSAEERLTIRSGRDTIVYTFVDVAREMQDRLRFDSLANNYMFARSANRLRTMLDLRELEAYLSADTLQYFHGRGALFVGIAR